MEAHKKMGMMYDPSRAMAVNEKIAFAAVGLAKSNNTGGMETSVTAQMARRGVNVHLELCAKYPKSGNPWSREKANTVREAACKAVWHTK
jgi:hypothetical protein